MKLICSSVLLAVVSATALAQAPATTSPPDNAAPMTDAERARRDANKVFQFIKLQAVRTNPAPAAAAAARPPAAAKPVAAVAAAAVVAPARPAATTAGAPVAGTAARPASVSSTETAVSAPQVAAGSTAALGTDMPGAAPTSAAAVAAAAVGSQTTPVNPTLPSAPLETEEIELAILKHVQPELPANRIGSLRSGSVWVQFTVDTDGSTKQVLARPGAQTRLAQSAVRAVEQWRFAPIPAARDVSIEFVFKLD